MPSVQRLRQAVLVAADYDAVADRIRSEFRLDAPFHDPGVAEFGLRNGVFAIGDTFLEVVSPTRAGTTAGRYLDRVGGDAGYMVMFQVPSVDAARERMERLGVRIVWVAEEEDIFDLHLHPRDVPGAIVSLTEARPAGSWRWAGPAWAGKVPEHRPGGVTSMTVRAADPAAVAARWAEVLDEPVAAGAAGPEIVLDGGAQVVRFVPADGGHEGIVEVGIALPAADRAGRDAVTVGGVRFTLTDAS